MKDILNMSEVQLNIECAKFMGYKIVYIENNYAHGYYAQKFSEHLGHNVNYKVPEYSKSLDLMHQAEEKIKEKGLEDKYVHILDTLVEEKWDEILEENWNYFNLIHASPLDRIKAVLLTIQEGE